MELVGIRPASELSSDTGSELAVLDIRLSAGPDTLQTSCHIVQTSQGWRFAAPLLIRREHSHIFEGRFVRLVQPDSDTVNQTALDSLDSFVFATTRKLGLPADRLARLGREKIDYHLCAAEEVTALAGAPTVGQANLQFDAVVTSHPAHFHELAHLLVNFWLQDLPLFTLPLLQEGLAVHLGGRWERSPAVLVQMGCFVLDSKFVEIPELLTRDTFLQQSADLTYAPAGLFTGFLLDALGPEQFRRLYLRMSGSYDEVGALSRDTIENRLQAAFGRPWSDVLQDFAAYRQKLPPDPLQPSVPGASTTGRQVAGQGQTCTLQESESGLTVIIHITPGQTPPDGPRGSLLITPGAADSRIGKSSALFAEHFPGRMWGGERYALRFSAAEVGLYDYALDLLVAKYVADFDPRPVAALWDAGHHRLCFHLERALIPARLEQAGITLLAH